MSHPGTATSILLSFCLALSSMATHAAEPATYTTLPAYKARAVFNGQDTIAYTASSQPNKLAASTAVLAECTTAHPNQTNANGRCELTHSDDRKISTTSDIRAGVDAQPHPLFLWKYTSPSATVYLAGSIHVLKPGLYPLPQPFMDAFDTADYLVLEVDPNSLTPQEMQFKVMQYGLLEDEQSLNSVLDPKLYAQLATVTQQYGLPIEQLNQFKPAFITQQLAVLALMSAGYDPTQGVEMHFIAQAGERDILQLESIDFQLDLLMNQPLNVQTKIVEEMIEQMDDFEPLTATLITAWLNGDDDTFEETFAEQAGSSEETREFTRQLMDQRNVGMADKIAAYLKTNGTYFVVIGAGHYVGPNNIIDLLSAKQLSGERMQTRPVASAGG